MKFSFEIWLRQQRTESRKKDKAIDYRLTNIATEIRVRQSENWGWMPGEDNFSPAHTFFKPTQLGTQ